MINSQLLLILALAMVAGIIVFRLYSVLGRKTGNERPPGEKWRFGGLPETSAARPQPQSGDTVTAMPARADAGANDSVARSLTDIKLADRGFETEHFLSGARKAYEMIVTAYAAGDRATLRPLLNDEVYGAFESVMTERDSRKEKVSFTFVGFDSVKIVHAELRGQTAEIAVEYAAQYISATIDAAGAVVDGDMKTPRRVVDHWSFARDSKSGDPNWVLVATSSGDDA